GGANVVKKLEDQADVAQNQNQNQSQAQAQAANRIITAMSIDDLKSYEEAVLARKAPVLKMPSKIKTRESPPGSSATSGTTNSGPSPPSLANGPSQSGPGSGPGSASAGPHLPPHSASGVLPPLSTLSSILPPVGSRPGGSVGSLFQNSQATLPTAAGASGVPVGSTPNTAMQGLTQNQDRPVIAMPRSRSRSRPSTASGTGPGGGGGGVGSGNVNPPTRPSSATMGISISPNGMIINHVSSANSSQPPSRPGTASSNASSMAPPLSAPLPGVLPGSVPTGGMMYSSHPQSQPNSRPSTSQAAFGGGGGSGSGAMSPSFAYMPPPPSHPPPLAPPGSSLPVEYGLHLHMANMAAAGGGSGVGDSPVMGSNRPAYKRNASQTLEPASNKRPHYRRGDTNFNPTMATSPNAGSTTTPNLNGSSTHANVMEEDGFDSDVSIGGSEYGGMQNYYHRYPNGVPMVTMMAAGGKPGSATTSPPPQYVGGMQGTGTGPMSPGRTPGSSASPGNTSSSSSSFTARRMSEPSAAAPRMIMRRVPPNQHHHAHPVNHHHPHLSPQMQTHMTMATPAAAAVGSGNPPN
ncbi:hypothetical protein FRC17_003532, partial [Serendipita sp. 399]